MIREPSYLHDFSFRQITLWVPIHSLQRLVHELPLGEAEPVLARRGLLSVHTAQQPRGNLLTHLRKVLAEGLGIVAVGRGLEGLVKGEAGIAGNGEVGVQGEVHQGLLGISPAHARLDGGQGLADEQDAINEHAVGGALDLEVAEEGVGAEEGENLVDRVVRLVRRLDRQLRHVGRQRGQLQRGAACPRAEREEGEVAYYVLVGLIEEDGS